MVVEGCAGSGGLWRIAEGSGGLWRVMEVCKGLWWATSGHGGWGLEGC